MQFRVSSESLQDSSSAEEWQARVDSRRHRLAFIQGFSKGIFNHLTLVVPAVRIATTRSVRTHWSEVTASCFMEVGIDDGEVKRGEGEVERLLLLHPRADPQGAAAGEAVFHTTCPSASALTRLEDPASRRSPD